MLKAGSLVVISPEDVKDTKNGISILEGGNQNIIIENSTLNERVPESVLNLAYRLMVNDESVKEIINELRVLFTQKKEEFHFFLSGREKKEKEVIVKLFQDMVGIISTFHYCKDCEMLSGKLIFSLRTLAFINGQYLEMALYKQTKEILDKLSVKEKKPYQLYRNVKVTTKQGRLKNEFDMVIDFGGKIYVVEIKSGKHFREFEKYAQISSVYDIVSNQFLLVDNYLSDEDVENAEYFCGYYVSNLKGNSFEKKLIKMLKNEE